MTGSDVRSSRGRPPALPGPPFLAVAGPSASGKTEASVPLAESLGAEIICVDSMLVYRGMDVGTAKPSPALQARVPHHLLDVAEPAEPFSAARFQSMARESVAGVRRRGRIPLLVGGTGLYFRAVVDDLEFPRTEPGIRAMLEAEAAVIGPAALHERLASFDPTAAGRIEPGNARRTVRALEVAAATGRPFSSFYGAWKTYPPGAVRAAGIDIPRAILHRRIEERVQRMFPGLLAEAQVLAERGFASFLTSSQAIGYAEAVAVLDGMVAPDEAMARTARRTKALAHRQMAWFRRDPRIRWFRAGEGGAAEILHELLEYLSEGERGATTRSRPGAQAKKVTTG